MKSVTQVFFFPPYFLTDFAPECFLRRMGGPGAGTYTARGELGWGPGCWSPPGDLGQEPPLGFSACRNGVGLENTAALGRVSGRVGSLGYSGIQETWQARLVD